MGRSARALLFALLASLPRGAPGQDRGRRSIEVADEISVGSGPVSPAAQRTAQVSDLLDAAFGVGRGLTLDLTLGLTWLQEANSDLRRQAGERSQPVLDVGAGLLWEASEHWAFDLALGWSPRSRLVSDSTIAYARPGGPAAAEALVAAASSKVGAEVGASWDTAGDSDFETGVDLGLAGRRYDTDQEVVVLRDPRTGQVLTPEQVAQDVRAQCRTPAAPNVCPLQLLGLLRQQPAELHQLAVRAAVAETLFLDTDVGLAWRWYLYDRDPTEVGFFRLADAGRGTAEFGSGVPMAPLAWSLRPSLARRLGRLTLRAWWEHGSYVQGLGTLDTFGARVQYRFASGFRLWLGGSIQRDRQTEGGTATLQSASVGAMIRW